MRMGHDGWSSGEDDTTLDGKQGTQLKQGMLSKRGTLLGAYNSPSSDEWSSSEDIDNVPMEPADGWVSGEDDTVMMNTTHRAPALSTADMASRYGKGFDLLSKLGGAPPTKASETPLVLPSAGLQKAGLGGTGAPSRMGPRSPVSSSFAPCPRPLNRPLATRVKATMRPQMPTTVVPNATLAGIPFGKHAEEDGETPSITDTLTRWDSERERLIAERLIAEPHVNESSQPVLPSTNSTQLVKSEVSTGLKPVKKIEGVIKPSAKRNRPAARESLHQSSVAKESVVASRAARSSDLLNRLEQAVLEIDRQLNQHIAKQIKQLELEGSPEEDKLNDYVEDDEDEEDTTTVRIGQTAIARALVPQASSPRMPHITAWLTDEINAVRNEFPPAILKEVALVDYALEMLQKALICDAVLWLDALEHYSSGKDAGSRRSSLSIVTVGESAAPRSFPGWLVTWGSSQFQYWLSYVTEDDPAKRHYFDPVMQRCILDRVLTPWLLDHWDPVSQTDVALKILDEYISAFVSPEVYRAFLLRSVFRKLSTTLDVVCEKSKVEFRPGPKLAHVSFLSTSHLWIFPWLPVLPQEGVDALVDKLIEHCIDAINSEAGPMHLPTLEWLVAWQGAASKSQWDRLLYTGMYQHLKRWLMAQRHVLSPAVPQTLIAFLEVWKDHLPLPLVSSAIVDCFGNGLVQQISTNKVPQSIELALEGYAAWKELRVKFLPDLQTWLHEVLIKLNKQVTGATEP